MKPIVGLILLASLGVTPVVYADQMSDVKSAFSSYRADEDAKDKARAAAAAAAEKKRQAQADHDRARNEAYDDEMRKLSIQERKAGVGASRAASSRANDYIDRDLKRQDAQTDLVQSHADANRNVSTGTRDMMQGIGKGAAKGLNY